MTLLGAEQDITSVLVWCRQAPGDPAVAHQVQEQDVPASSTTSLQVEQQSPLSTAQAETIVRTWQVSQWTELAVAVRLQQAALPSAIGHVAKCWKAAAVFTPLQGFLGPLHKCLAAQNMVDWLGLCHT